MKKARMTVVFFALGLTVTLAPVFGAPSFPAAPAVLSNSPQYGERWTEWQAFDDDEIPMEYRVQRSSYNQYASSGYIWKVEVRSNYSKRITFTLTLTGNKGERSSWSSIPLFPGRSTQWSVDVAVLDGIEVSNIRFME